MNLIAKLAARNTMRRRTRTLLTVGMVVVAVALLMIALTWVRGIFGTITRTAANMSGHVRLVTTAFAEREELMPLYENIYGVEKLAASLRTRPGVARVEPRVTTGVTISAGDEIGDVFGLAVGASPTYLEERTGARAMLTAGTWFTGGPGELVAGSKVMRQAGAKIGDEIILLAATQDGSLSSIKAKLVGIFHAGGVLDQQLLLPLEDVQYLTDLEDAATEVLVYGETHDQAGPLAEALRAEPALEPYDVRSYGEREPWRSLSSSVEGIENIIVFVIVFLAALGIWNTMTMSVLERTHEIGVLRALGLSRLGAVLLFLGEASIIGGLGSLLGIALGVYPAWLLESQGITIGEQTAANMPMGLSEKMYGDLSVESTLLALILGLLMALVGSVLPALRAASIQPVSAMRSGR